MTDDGGESLSDERDICERIDAMVCPTGHSGACQSKYCAMGREAAAEIRRLRALVAERSEDTPGAGHLRAIDDEPELPGDMPDAMWDEFQDRERATEALRALVRVTKRNIRDRVLAIVREGEPRWRPTRALRDYFAGQAMLGMLAPESAVAIKRHAESHGLDAKIVHAEMAYALADAMLTARTEEPTK